MKTFFENARNIKHCQYMLYSVRTDLAGMKGFVEMIYQIKVLTTVYLKDIYLRMSAYAFQ